MLTVKPGVAFAVIAPAGWRILEAVRRASHVLDTDLMITSGTDGEHSGPADPHHTGEAFDIRSNIYQPPFREKVLATIMADLNWAQFYGFLEDPGLPNEHYHIQRAKGTIFSFADYLKG